MLLQVVLQQVSNTQTVPVSTKSGLGTASMASVTLPCLCSTAQHSIEYLSIQPDVVQRGLTEGSL